MILLLFANTDVLLPLFISRGKRGAGWTPDQGQLFLPLFLSHNLFWECHQAGAEYGPLFLGPKWWPLSGCSDRIQHASTFSRTKPGYYALQDLTKLYRGLVSSCHLTHTQEGEDTLIPTAVWAHPLLLAPSSMMLSVTLSWLPGQFQSFQQASCQAEMHLALLER